MISSKAGFLRGNVLESDLAENFRKDRVQVVESILTFSDFFLVYLKRYSTYLAAGAIPVD
jgi:hypothetical protein